MFRFLLMITGLLSGLALAQLTRDRVPDAAEDAADTPADEAAEPGHEDAPGLVAVMAERPASETVDDVEAATSDDTAPRGSADAELDDTIAAAAGEPLADVEDVMALDELDEGPVGVLGSRRVRAIAIAGAAALVGFGLGYLVIRRARPDLLAGLSLARIRPTAIPSVTLPAVELRIPDLAEIHVPDLAELRATRLPTIERTRLGSAAPAVRSAVASAIASALATSLAARIAARR
jgi:hypothetical protein